MQDIHDFVALRALFNIDLHEALLNKDSKKVISILRGSYKEDMEQNVSGEADFDIEKACGLYQSSLSDPKLAEIFL